MSDRSERIEGHAGEQAVAAMRGFGVDVLFTLNGGHIWPLYEACRNQGVRVVDTRHEQSATFAAEAYAKLTRRPGVAALTAGPGITNGVSAVTSAWFNGSPLVVLGGRAPQRRWGAGSLQELDHVPILASITKSATTVFDAGKAGVMVHDAIALAAEPHRGPVFLDFPLDVFGPAAGDIPAVDAAAARGVEPDGDAVAELAALVAGAERPAFVVGSDVYWDGAWAELAAAVEHLRVPVFANGLGRGTLPADHELAFLRTRALLKIAGRRRGRARHGARLPARLRALRRGDRGPRRRRRVTAGRPRRRADGRRRHRRHAARPRRARRRARPTTSPGSTSCGAPRRRRGADEEPLLAASGGPIKPTRVYGELRQRLARDAVVICDGGDFASYAGKYVEVFEPGGWLDTGPYGCLGNGMGYSIAARVVRPDAQIVMLLGDGAAGFSLMDADSLVRQGLPVVMVVGNNGMWGLEKHPMQAIYGWDVACDLQPGCRYDEVVTALGGGGELVTDPEQVGPALDRAFASGVPYVVNVVTDPSDVYPRSSNLG